MNASKDTIVRTIVLAVTWLNMLITTDGKNPLPFSDEEIYQGATYLVTLIATLWSYWKNNSWTEAAVEGDKYKNAVKESEEK